MQAGLALRPPSLSFEKRPQTTRRSRVTAPVYLEPPKRLGVRVRVTTVGLGSDWSWRTSTVEVDHTHPYTPIHTCPAQKLCADQPCTSSVMAKARQHVYELSRRHARGTACCMLLCPYLLFVKKKKRGKPWVRMARPVATRIKYFNTSRNRNSSLAES